jgi:hypothetical protein
MEIRMKRLNIMSLGLISTFVLASGVCLVATTYIKLEERVQSEQARTALLDRLAADQKISAALEAIRDGEVRAGAQRLDLLLCDDILEVRAEITSADSRAQASAKAAWVQIARSRPKNAEIGGGGGWELSSDQIAAARILAEAVPATCEAEGLAAKH